MEKCFIIESSAELHKKYFDYIALQDKNNKIIKKFVSENITERTNFTYATYRDSFALVLTDDEYERFKSQLLKNYSYADHEKIYTFKKKSFIGKLYKQLGIKPAYKPSITWEANILCGKYRLFDYEGILYGTIDSSEINAETIFPASWSEISKSEFYAVIDKIEQEMKS